MNFTDLRIIRTQERLQNAMLELLEAKELKEITVKEICGIAGISRNAFYQHYSSREDLYSQMTALATEKIRISLLPLISEAALVKQETVALYARRIIDCISEVRDLIRVMLKGDDGKFLRQLTDLISRQNLVDAIPFFDVKDSPGLRLYYEYLSAGMAAFIIKWVVEEQVAEEEAAALLADILVRLSASVPKQLAE